MYRKNSEKTEKALQIKSDNVGRLFSDFQQDKATFALGWASKKNCNQIILSAYNMFT